MIKINKRNILIIITMVLAIATSVFILVEAGLNGQKSAEQSGMVVEVVETVVDTIAPGTINETNIDDVHNVIRKVVGHFLLFSLAGFFATWTSMLLLENKTYKSKLWFLNIAIPLGYGFILAAISEVIQLFAGGRSGEFKDVMIDFGGYFLGFTIIFLVLFFLMRRNEKRKKVEMNSFTK